MPYVVTLEVFERGEWIEALARASCWESQPVDGAERRLRVEPGPVAGPRRATFTFERKVKGSWEPELAIAEGPDVTLVVGSEPWVARERHTVVIEYLGQDGRGRPGERLAPGIALVLELSDTRARASHQAHHDDWRVGYRTGAGDLRGQFDSRASVLVGAGDEVVAGYVTGSGTTLGERIRCTVSDIGNEGDSPLAAKIVQRSSRIPTRRDDTGRIADFRDDLEVNRPKFATAISGAVAARRLEPEYRAVAGEEWPVVRLMEGVLGLKSNAAYRQGSVDRYLTNACQRFGIPVNDLGLDIEDRGVVRLGRIGEQMLKMGALSHDSVDRASMRLALHVEFLDEVNSQLRGRLYGDEGAARDLGAMLAAVEKRKDPAGPGGGQLREMHELVRVVYGVLRDAEVDDERCSVGAYLGLDPHQGEDEYDSALAAMQSPDARRRALSMLRQRGVVPTPSKGA
ncbi:hypothetical protein QQX13_02470 [Demequina sp. SYSU T00068]|uniref:hypothetical protein n=1 Tax=Demequina lignilytica TaxID=3051663 RepID=UPI002602CC43|nr:hypothetical protein [Demequina sp. SYSU T00068]MDN4489689.1 hypothetical protein [Demequina sp. SYSU T00068]